MLKISVKKGTLAFIILIGGSSSRFGRDKGIFKFRGKPLLSYPLEILSRFEADIFISAHSNQQIQSYTDEIEYLKDFTFILDDKEIIREINNRTPMLGLYSAFIKLQELGYEKVLALSCDMPLIIPEVINLLINQSNGYDCSIPRWKNGFIEPLFAIYPVEKAIITAKASLKKKTFKLTNLLDDNWKINYVSIENQIKPLDKELLSFFNVNRQSDIEILKEKLNRTFTKM